MNILRTSEIECWQLWDFVLLIHKWMQMWAKATDTVLPYLTCHSWKNVIKMNHLCPDIIHVVYIPMNAKNEIKIHRKWNQEKWQQCHCFQLLICICSVQETPSIYCEGYLISWRNFYEDFPLAEFVVMLHIVLLHVHFEWCFFKLTPLVLGILLPSSAGIS